jgi:16S rRNA (guanine527-N7)-methyltransferase
MSPAREVSREVSREVLRQVLEDARTAGFLGPGPIEPHLRHAEGFAHAAEAALRREPGAFADLGTGGGVPGLALALRWPESWAILVDSNQRRCAALREAVERLGIARRVEVLEERAEAVGRPGEQREAFDLVTARSFAEPAVTAEVAAGLVRIGGVLVVSEPPTSENERWPSARLAELGFGPAELVEQAGAHFAAITKVAATPDRYPRRVGQPAKRPLW